MRVFLGTLGHLGPVWRLRLADSLPSTKSSNFEVFDEKMDEQDFLKIF